MGLRDLAEQDLGGILEDADSGFGWPITLTNPAGLTAPLVGFSDDISQAVDPDTGLIVSSRMASVALRLSSLYAAGFAMPRGVTSRDSLPWVVTFDDINGVPYTFKIRETAPDRTLGLVVCMLENYKP